MRYKTGQKVVVDNKRIDIVIKHIVNGLYEVGEYIVHERNLRPLSYSEELSDYSRELRKVFKKFFVLVVEHFIKDIRRIACQKKEEVIGLAFESALNGNIVEIHTAEKFLTPKEVWKIMKQNCDCWDCAYYHENFDGANFETCSCKDMHKCPAIIKALDLSAVNEEKIEEDRK